MHDRPFRRYHGRGHRLHQDRGAREVGLLCRHRDGRLSPRARRRRRGQGGRSRLARRGGARQPPSLFDRLLLRPAGAVLRQFPLHPRLAGIAVGAAIGAINGYFYVYRKIKSFIVTICTMFLFRGFIKYLTTNAPVAGSAKLINYDSTGLKVACTVVILIIGFIAFRYTKFGTYLKAIGAGEKAAMFSGIRTDKMKFLIYVLAGAITGFAAFINVIKVGSVTSSGGNQLETQILIALVLGGMPISGGAKVRFENIVVGSLLYIVLNSGLTMMGFTTQMMQLIQGIVFLIFVAVFADRESIQVIK